MKKAEQKHCVERFIRNVILFSVFIHHRRSCLLKLLIKAVGTFLERQNPCASWNKTTYPKVFGMQAPLLCSRCPAMWPIRVKLVDEVHHLILLLEGHLVMSAKGFFPRVAWQKLRYLVLPASNTFLDHTKLALGFRSVNFCRFHFEGRERATTRFPHSP